MLSSLASRLQIRTNPLYRIVAEMESCGRPPADLVAPNLNEEGFTFPQELLDEILRDAVRLSAVYRPDSFGRPEAREAVSEYYRGEGLDLPPENILLTPGSSIAYWYCFKLLADEGDEILCPRPSYPLFDYIASLSGVRMVPYDLRESRGWSIGMDELDAVVSTRTRALILISPHNPTGHVSPPEELRGVAEVCVRHNLAIISDEVFSGFLLRDGPFPRAASHEAGLVLTLNGFSKMFALPGLKLGWIAVSGERSEVRKALKALELISDTFLPVSEPVQAAVPDILRKGAEFAAWLRREVRQRYALASGLLRGCPAVRFCEPDGGFYVTLDLADQEEESCAEALLRKESLLVHPGYFYDIPGNHLVLSFVSRPEVMEPALRRLGNVLLRTE